MAKKSIWNQISNPREKYTDGYGVSRSVHEPGYITAGRKIYDGVDKFLNGPGNVNGMPINTGAGALEFFFDPSSIGKLDDVAKLTKHLDKFKMDELRRFKLRRKVNSRPEAEKRIVRNAFDRFPVEYKTINDPIYGTYKVPTSTKDYDLEEAAYQYYFDRMHGDEGQFMDILWRRGDLDGVKHPKINHTYEELPF